MIFETIHVPGLYRDLPTDAIARDLYLDALLRILQDAEENCVILVDDRDLIVNDISSAVSQWPDTREALRVKERLKKLRKRLQLVPVVVADLTPACACALTIAAKNVTAAVFAPTTCTCSIVCADSRFIRPGQYNRSPFGKQRRDGLEVLKTHGAWSAGDFEDEILRPLFRHAKTVKLFDRYIGRHLIDRDGHGAAVKDGVDADWKDSLDWILGSFASSTTHRDERTVIVYGGIDGGRLSPEQLRKADSLLQQVAREIGDRHQLEIELHVKVEFKNTNDMREMRHARFIFVDQAAFEIDRGFDLLTPTARVKDFTMKRIAGRETIEAEIRKLKDVEDYLAS